MNQMRKIALVGIFIGLAELLGANDQAILRCAVFDAPPFIILGKNPIVEPCGIDIDLIRELSRRLGVSPSFQEASWARCLNLMKSGRTDLLSSVYRNPERETYLHYLDPPYINQLPIAFFYRADSPVSIQSYDDVHHYSPIGVLLDASYFAKFDTDKQITRETISSQEQILPMLAKGRIPVAICYVDTQNYYTKIMGYSGILARSEFVWSEKAEVYLSLSRKSPFFKRQAEFDTVWQAMVKDGFVRNTIAKYRALYP